MFPHKESFFKFEEVDGVVVCMGNGDVGYITGIGSIRLRNHDGVIRVLIDVWYVSKLEKNLISSGVLEFKGLVMIIRGGVLNVISGAVLVMKGTRRNNLYYYNGTTRIRLVATVSGSGQDS